MISISIITATYNAASTIADCLTSIQAQSHTAEKIIIDGQSSDGTLEVVTRMLSDARIISESDRGIYDAMNKGIKLVGGEVVGILNADDFYADDKVLERVANVFKDQKVEVCYGDLLYVKEASTRHRAQGAISEVGRQRRNGVHNFQIVRYWKSGSFHPNKFYQGWMPPHPTFFVRRSVYEKYGAFNLGLGSAADYELMLRFLLKHRIKVAYIPEILVKMRVGGASNTSLSNRLKANRMDRKAWEINGLNPYPWTLWMKPLRKIPQWWMKPPEFS